MAFPWLYRNFGLKMMLTFLVVISSSSARIIDSKSVFRSGDMGTVNLVEFNVGGFVYGKCSFQNANGELVSVVFESLGDQIKAKNLVPSLSDPVAETRKCRETAARDINIKSRESLGPQSVSNYLRPFGDNYVGSSNAQYWNPPNPRFINFVPQTSSSSTTSTGLMDRIADFINSITFGTFDFPIPVMNVPIRFQDFNIPIIVPQIQTLRFPAPFLG